MSHNHGDTIPLHPSLAQSDMDEIESLIHAAPGRAVEVRPDLQRAAMELDDDGMEDDDDVAAVTSA
jgi:hypothetical protein